MKKPPNICPHCLQKPVTMSLGMHIKYECPNLFGRLDDEESLDNPDEEAHN